MNENNKMKTIKKKKFLFSLMLNLKTQLCDAKTKYS